MVAEIRETIGRQALIALSNQYESVADALMELVDNPFDYRRGRTLQVEVEIRKQKGRDEISVLDYGGEGMDDQSLADWISWGTGHQHTSSDIGQYHVGGKLAVIYLAEGIEIIARRAGSPNVWQFKDPRWGSRTELLSVKPRVLPPTEVPPHLQTIPGDAGFTFVRMTNLKDHRYEPGILLGRLANTYRALLLNGQCAIRVNGDLVEALDIPVSSAYEPITIPKTKVGGVTIRGRIWVTDRERLKVGRGVSPKAGIRTIFNGRLITDGEEFGHYLAGRGQLQRLFGEIELEHLRPNTTKDGWDKSSPGWTAVHDEMNRQMQPLVTFLNQLVEGAGVSRDQKKRANRILREIDQVFKLLLAGTNPLGDYGDAAAADGRRPPTARDTQDPPPGPPHLKQGEREPRTPAPPDAVGRLLRKRGGRLPAVDFDHLGEPHRSQMTNDRETLVISLDYPLYKAIGTTDEYLFETMVLELLKEEMGEGAASDLLDEMNRIAWAWNKLALTESSGH